MSYRKIYYYDLPNGFTGIIDRYATGTQCFVPISKFDMGLTNCVSKAFADTEMKRRYGKWYFGPKFTNITEAREYVESKGATYRKSAGMRS